MFLRHHVPYIHKVVLRARQLSPCSSAGYRRAAGRSVYFVLPNAFTCQGELNGLNSISIISEQTTTPGIFTSLDIKPQNGLGAAMYSLGGPSGIRYDVNFQGCIRNFVIDQMKPVESYLQNDADYAMYGSTTMGTC